MNQTSLEKIQAATMFLCYFRSCIPVNIQAVIRPYLDQPYQLALNILDCYEGANGCTAEDIAQRLAVSKSSVRQVLGALRDGGLVSKVTTGKGRSLPTSTSLNLPTPFPSWSRPASSIHDGKAN